MKRFILTLTIALFAVSACLAQKVLLIGDSHVAGNTYPQTAKAVLKEKKPSVEFSWHGIIGASYQTYSAKSRLGLVAKRRPDILIVALGTNDCYGKGYVKSAHVKKVVKFCRAVRTMLPDVRIFLVTPFECGTDRKPHPNMSKCSQAIREAADSADVEVLDINNRHGRYFIDRNLFQKDHVHLTRKGYSALGRMLAIMLCERLGH